MKNAKCKMQNASLVFRFTFYTLHFALCTLHFLMFLILVCLMTSPIASHAQPPGRYALPYNHAAYDRPPTEEDLSIPREEDLAFLDSVLKTIFPEGMQGLTDEQKSIEVLRYVSSALLLKSNGGSATKVLREGYAICGGMSHAFRILCRRAGVPSRYIGAFYLRPIMGSHAISEVFCGGKWRLLDPTFGIFFYSGDAYDGKGEIASFHDMIADPAGWTPMKVVSRPWGGKYDRTLRVVQKVEPDYLKDFYGAPITDLYRKYLRETFPVAYGSDDLVSFPVDADLRMSKDLWFGGIDSSSTDVVLLALNGTQNVGGHYLGGSFPHGLHTWSIQAPENAVLTVEYYSADAKPAELKCVSLKGLHLLSYGYEGKKAAFTFRMIGTEGILAVTCPAGSYTVDAMRIYIK